MFIRKLLLLSAAGAALAGCVTDQNSSSGGGSPGGTSSLAQGQLLQQAPQLGVSGTGGLAQDLLGQDVVASLLSTGPGPVPAVVAGGENGILGSVADPLASVLPDLPALPSLPAPVSLGITGPGGLVEDLAGQDVLGAALGAPGGMVPTDKGLVPLLLAGGNDGVLGDVVPAGASSSLPLPGVLSAATGAASAGGTNQLTQVLSTLTSILP